MIVGLLMVLIALMVFLILVAPVAVIALPTVVAFVAAIMPMVLVCLMVIESIARSTWTDHRCHSAARGSQLPTAVPASTGSSHSAAIRYASTGDEATPTASASRR